MSLSLAQKVLRHKFWFLLILCVCCASLSAQVRTGNIYGTVMDEDGNPLPGAVVTLTGSLTAPVPCVCSAKGIYRFLSLSPAVDYTIRAELPGFQTEVQENIIVVVGANVEINITIKMGTMEEEITVIAETPVVDLRQTTVGMNVTHEVLQSIPTARDPWVILQMAPGVIVADENVGGSSSGQQYGFYARGGSMVQNAWYMDGMSIMDIGSVGYSPGYYDFDSFEEVQITVGGADVTVQTGGVALNMVTRRGGNRVSLGGRFYLVDSKFQATNEAYLEEIQETEPYFLGMNKIRDNKDYGFNLGLPIVQDKAWFWGSWGVQDIKTNTVYDKPDDTLLKNIAAKLNIQFVPANRFEAFVHTGSKEKWGRDSFFALPSGYYQGDRLHFGSPIYKIQDEHMFGDNLFVSAKISLQRGGLQITPMDDLDFVNTPYYDVINVQWKGPDDRVGEWGVSTTRPLDQYGLLANYFNDSLLGASHDVKLGLDYADGRGYTESLYNGNMTVRWNYNQTTLDFNGDGLPDVPADANFYNFEYWRGYYRDYGVRAWAAYFSDTITFGRFNLLLGIRYDYQTPKINQVMIEAVTDSPAWDFVDPQTKAVLDGMLPGVEIPDTDILDINGERYAWRVWSPRLGLTWDMTGDGRTIAKISFASYGNRMGVGSYGQMPGGTSGWLNYWWWDNSPDTGRSPDGIVQLDELYWHTVGDGNYAPVQLWPDKGEFQGDWSDAAGTFWGGYDPENPVQLEDPYQTRDGDAGSIRTWETILTLEREVMTDFAVSLNATYRRYGNDSWSLKEFRGADGQTVLSRDQQGWYTDWSIPLDSISQYLPEEYTKWDGSLGEAPSHPYQYQKSEFTDPDSGETINPSAYSPYTHYTKRLDYYQDYFGLDLIFNKRLSNRWMLQGSLTWQHQAVHYGAQGFTSSSNIWALDGRVYAPLVGGGAGKTPVYTFSRWLIKLGGLFQLPYDVNVSYSFQAREGYILHERLRLTDYTIPNPRNSTQWLYLNTFGDDRLDTFYKLDLRLEKMFRSGDFGRIYVMADLFNALNSTIQNRRYVKDWGYFYYYGAEDSRNRFVENVAAYTLSEVLNPRVLRLGVRFQF